MVIILFLLFGLLLLFSNDASLGKTLWSQNRVLLFFDHSVQDVS
jgi:hypothetical protein